jgi:hypothetical protein
MQSPLRVCKVVAVLLLPCAAVRASPAIGVPVWLDSDDGEKPLVDIYADGTQPGRTAALARCRLPCGFWLRGGQYFIQVVETSDYLGGGRWVSVVGPTRLAITPRKPMKRTLWLVLGIAGAVAVTVGAGLFIDGDERLPPSRLCAEHVVCSPSWTAEMIGGLLTFAAGAAATPAGWVLFGKSFRPAIDVRRPTVGSSSRSHVGLIGLPGGAGFGGEWMF